LKASSPKYAYKDSLVKEMKEFVDSFYSKMSSKIPLIIEMKTREMKEMNAIVKANKSKRSSENVSCSNPIYPSIQKPGDSSRKLVHYVSAKSILQQSQEWPLSGSSFLNKETDAISMDSACPSMASSEYSVNPSDVIYEETYNK